MKIIEQYLLENSISDFSKYNLVDKGNGVEIENWDYDIDKPNFKKADYELSLARSAKISEIKNLRNSNLKKATPQTVGAYDDMDSLINKTFNISQNDVEKFNTIISRLQEKIDNGAVNPTRSWKTITGRVRLNIDEFRSLRNHLEDRDEQEYDQADLKITAINSFTTIEEVEAFDINEVMV